MKTFTLLLSALLFGHLLIAQSPASITLSQDTLCAGESVQAEALPPSYGLSTPASTANNQHGYMFDVTAKLDATITGFEISPLTGGATYYVYYRTGSHVGHENSSSGWTLLDSATNVPAGTAINPGFSFSQPIVAGQTLAFYITSDGGSFTYYDNGTSVGNVLVAGSYLEVKEGVGKAYPFGNTYSPRNFVGKILYSPKVIGYNWNTGETTAAITLTPARSSFLRCNMEIPTGINSASQAVTVKEVGVQTMALPATVQSGQQSTLSTEVTLNRGLGTNHDVTNSQNGAMFDLEAADSIQLHGFTVSPTTDTGTIDIEVFYKTGTFVGSEGNAAAWTSLGTYNGLSKNTNLYLDLNTPLWIIPGQTLGFYITATDGDRLQYDNGSTLGQIAKAANGLAIREGKGVVYPFGTTYSPRVLKTFVHFTAYDVPGASYNWSTGGSSGSVVVNPTATTDYTVTVTVDGCTTQESVTVTVAGVGIDPVSAQLKVHPNPAQDWLRIELTDAFHPTALTILNSSGAIVRQQAIGAGQRLINLPVADLAAGLYLLQLRGEGQPVTYKWMKL